MDVGNGFADSIKTFWDRVKYSLANDNWFPSTWELLLFGLIYALIIIWMILLYYSDIQNDVINNSRCYKDKNKYKYGNNYKVVAYDPYNNPLYSVEYNLADKKYATYCECEKGDNVNKFDVQTWSFNSKKPEKIEKMCQCSRNYNMEETNVYYKGYPELVRYMKDGNRAFFTS